MNGNNGAPSLLYVGMKYDYGDEKRGLSYEYRNFQHSLQSYCARRNWDFHHYDFMQRCHEIGRENMTEELYSLVKEKPPTCLFAVLFDFDKDPIHQVFKAISDLGTKTIHWFCDDHWRFERYSSTVAPNFDIICTTAMSALPKYEALGIGNRVIRTQWACNHELYIPYQIPRNVDISFVGQPHGNRVQTLSLLEQNGVRVDVYGFGWQDRPRIPFHQMVRLFSRSKVNLNLSNSSTLIGQQIKGRNFEVPGSRGFLLTGNAEDLRNYFTDGEEIVIFESDEELLEKACYFLKNDKERERIAMNGYRRTLEEHTWHHRYSTIFSHAGIGKHCV